MLHSVGSHLGVGTVVEPTPSTELCQDAVDIVADWDKETLTVYRLTADFTGIIAGETWGLQSTFSGDWQPISGRVQRAEEGLSVKSTAFIIAGCDLGILADDKIYRTDGTFEYVNYVKRYHGHTTVFLKKQKGSN